MTNNIPYESYIHAYLHMHVRLFIIMYNNNCLFITIFSPLSICIAFTYILSVHLPLSQAS